MAAGSASYGRLPESFSTPGTSSFTDLLGQVAPELLPGRRAMPPGNAGHLSAHGTTIVALQYAGGVVMAGDRRATAGNMIANRDMRKVYPADEFSVIGIAGSAGLALEFVRLFQVELEHYEKMEGVMLSLSGKATKLANMVRGNLAAAMQGLAVVPLFAGIDPDAADPASSGRIWSYDPTGGPYPEQKFHSVGSGSIFARNSMKKLYRDDLDGDRAVRLAIEALYDAADDDTATGGPDLGRQIFPLVFQVDIDGAREIDGDTIAALTRTVVQDRTANPGG
ncbi:proteasome subunit beta [Fodinicola feengrottensis]|uniref:Proteasome subunit beta n=1 Tax=Fodinicola feengrottensis TaxID=435914 RepID=A0ABN2HX49_9ACTN|nr:proteasome subunit beta [Fodinicola feengrottensis]